MGRNEWLTPISSPCPGSAVRPNYSVGIGMGQDDKNVHSPEEQLQSQALIKERVESLGGKLGEPTKEAETTK